MKTLFYTIQCLALVSFLLFPQNDICAATQGSGGTLTVSTTTSRAGGPLSLKNNVVIFVEDANGKLINTLLYNTKNLSSSATDLVLWYAHLGTWVNRTKYTNIDVITSATNKSYGVKTAYWGKKVDISGEPDGLYTVRMELVDVETDEGEISYQTAAYTFMKGPLPSTGTLLGSPSISFLNTSISWVPGGVSDDKQVKLNSLYSIYPNPAKSTIYVDGLEISEVEILTMSGKSLLKCNQQKIDISEFKAGKYLVRINSSQGEVVKVLFVN